MSEIKNISQAVAEAIKGVYILGKDDRNSHGNYAFASIDKFLEMVNPICAAHGLFPVMTCVGIESYEGKTKSGTSLWGRYTFDITLTHMSGETLPAQTIIVPVQITGAQASGSAQSYALKQYFRGLFMIPTGDKDDPDFNKPVEFESTITAEQVLTLRTRLEAVDADIPVFLGMYKLTKLEDMQIGTFADALAMIEKKAKKISELTQEETDALLKAAG